MNFGVGVGSSADDRQRDTLFGAPWRHQRRPSVNPFANPKKFQRLQIVKCNYIINDIF